MEELRRQLEELIAHRATPSVSIYMPMAGVGAGAQEDRIRFKNLVKRAGELASATDGGANLRTLDLLLEEDGFWRKRSPGLAFFHSPKGTQLMRLPVAPTELVVVEDRFHLKPLLAIVGEAGRFYVLGVSQSATRLLEVTRDEVRRIDASGMPDSLDATLPAELGDKQLQYHTGGGDDAIYHGQGAGERRETEDLRRFLSSVGAALTESVQDQESPVVVAGVTQLTSMFAELSEHRSLVSPGVEGNVDRISDEALAERARPFAKARLREARLRAVKRIEALSHTERVVARVDQVVPAAVEGRVDSLFVAKDERCWGAFDPRAGHTTIESKQSEHNVDLLDLAAIRTFEQGGSVFIVAESEMPKKDTPAVALLRY